MISTELRVPANCAKNQPVAILRSEHAVELIVVEHLCFESANGAQRNIQHDPTVRNAIIPVRRGIGIVQTDAQTVADILNARAVTEDVALLQIVLDTAGNAPAAIDLKRSRAGNLMLIVD
jgi:hypothetical protein